MKEKLNHVLPWYGILPILCCLIFNVIVYNGNRLLTADRVHYDFAIPFIDDRIPFWRWMIVFYVLSYAFWALGFIVIAREDRETCYELFSGELIGKFLCLVFYLAFPTVMVDWPSGTFEIENGFDWLTQFIYNMDEPNNLFPSIHCSESWFCFRGAMRCKKVGNGYRVFCLLMALAIFASTVMVKQHVFIDILGGVAVAEIGIFWARKLRAGRIFTVLERKKGEGT